MESDDKNVDNMPGGDIDNMTGQASGNQDKGEVSYSTYKKTLTQLKNLQEKYKEKESVLNQFQSKEKELEQKRLEEQGEYKKLLEMERQKLNQYEAEKNEYKEKLINAHKLNAFNEKLPSKISNPKYYDHVPVDDIIIDPETGMVDESSVDHVVSSFVKEHYQLLDSKNVQMPSNAPAITSKLTYEQWVKLPVKEKRERINEVYKSDT